jgi:hypothetical protein
MIWFREMRKFVFYDFGNGVGMAAGKQTAGTTFACMPEIKIFHDPTATPEEWRVEEVDSDGEGGCDVVIFTGPHAEERARRFAEGLQTY